MSKKRESKPVAKVNLSQVEIDTLLQNFAIADAELEKISAKIDLEKLKITDRYKDKIAEHQEKKDAAYVQLKTYYETNREELFPTKKKSIETLFGKIGFQTGQPALKTIKGFTWESAKNLVKEFLPNYIRTKEEVNKESLLADRETNITDDLCSEEMKTLPEEERPVLSSLFARCGIKIEQDENFYIELKKEEVTA